MKKRGVSPVISSVLLIMLVMVLASIIFLWARGFIGEQVEKFGAPIEDSCQNVAFDVARVNGTNTLEIQNRGSIDIRRFDVKTFSGGDSDMKKLTLQVDAGGSGSGSVDLEMDNGSDSTEVIVYPVLIGTIRGGGVNSVFTCINSGVVL